MSLISDKYQAVKKKLEESHSTNSSGRKSSTDTDGSKVEVGEIPTSIENENFDPVTEDFEADADDDVVGVGDGRCRPIDDFDPDDGGNGMPGKSWISSMLILSSEGKIRVLCWNQIVKSFVHQSNGDPSALGGATGHEYR